MLSKVENKKNIQPNYDSYKGGKWEKPFESKVVGIHTSLLYDGKVLFFTYPSKGDRHDHDNHEHKNHNIDTQHNNNSHSHGSAERTGDSEILDPITKESKRIVLDRNIFCGGACF
jgi:hypothetical protein